MVSMANAIVARKAKTVRIALESFAGGQIKIEDVAAMVKQMHALLKKYVREGRSNGRR